MQDLNASPNELHQESFGLHGERGEEEVKYQLVCRTGTHSIRFIYISVLQYNVV